MSDNTLAAWLKNGEMAANNPEMVKLAKEEKKAQDPNEKLFKLIQLCGERLDANNWRREYKFHRHRNWRFDLANPELQIAVIVQGGLWMQTKTGRGKGHAHPTRIIQDMEKRNAANMLGWCVLEVQPVDVDNGAAIALLKQAIPPVWKV